jgi:DNA (cytosine-5)-methyltransferase 1
MAKKNLTPSALSRDTPPSVAAIDLFCGAGGLTRGLEDAGINVALGVDLDPSCTFPYEKNNKARFLLKSVSDVTGHEINKIFDVSNFTLLAGCAPCQPFSKYRLGKSDESDDRWNLLAQFQRLVRETKPDIVTMENVPRLQRESVFASFVKSLESQGYNVWNEVVNCSDYGVPQQRERLVLLASRLGSISLKPIVSRRKTVREAIGKLPPIIAGEICENDPLHQASRLSLLNYTRIRASTPGGTWRDWDDELVADCHKKKSGKTYPAVYGRMMWDQPSPTVTTQFFGFGNGRFGHPEQDRALSLREGAILQSFPKGYKFCKLGEPIFRKTIGRLIGNAVPVKLGEAIGKCVIAHVEAHKRSNKRRSLWGNM